MNATIYIDKSYLVGERSTRVINFSSGLFKALANVPSTVISLLLYPVSLLMVPILNSSLRGLANRIRKDMEDVKASMSELEYEKAMTAYEFLNPFTEILNDIVKESDPTSLNFLTKGLYKNIAVLAGLFSEINTSLSDVLFIKTENHEPLSEKEKKAVKSLDEVWGDDEDKAYARLTHHHLSKKMRLDGI